MFSLSSVLHQSINCKPIVTAKLSLPLASALTTPGDVKPKKMAMGYLLMTTEEGRTIHLGGDADLGLNDLVYRKFCFGAASHDEGFRKTGRGREAERIKVTQ